MRSLLSMSLRDANFAVVSTSSAVEAVRLARESSPALIVMDWMLQEGDGLSAVAKIRLFSRVPILMLTARHEVDDKVLGLSTGADDYLTKPFAMEEFIARLHALLRRQHTHSSDGDGAISFANQGLTIDRSHRQVKVRGREINLTPKEYALLVFLAGHPETVVSRAELATALFPSAKEITNAAIDTQVSRLRRKIEQFRTCPQLIITVHRVGYKLKTE